MALIHEHAPAKINLTLRVAGRRDDGFHELQSLVAFARGIADVVTLDTGRGRGVSVRGPFAATIAGENLIAHALAKIEAVAPEIVLGHVDLVKNLPVAAGIGGGSADAGALLRAVVKANAEVAETIDWQSIAVGLGADVPVCFASRAAWMTGIGDQLAAVENLPTLFSVLVNPQTPMPADKTAQVFRGLGASKLAHDYTAPDAPRFANADELLAAISKTGNDLLPPAKIVAPVIAEMIDTLKALPGCRHAGLSGGGPTCFGIFGDATLAMEARKTIESAYPGWWVRASSLN